MTYLSIANFWKYQNADVWKKAKTHPPWFKYYVHRDRQIDALPLEARLLWVELLAAATRYSNVLEADLNWIHAETRVPTEVIAEMLPLLLKGGWLSQTKTAKRSRKPSRENLEDPLEPTRPDQKKSKPKPPDQKPLTEAPPTGLENGSPSETLEELAARLEANAAPIGSEGRLLEVLTDMDANSPAVIHALLEKLPAHTIEQVRDEVLHNNPRSPVKYAVGMLRRRVEQRAGRTAPA